SEGNWLAAERGASKKSQQESGKQTNAKTGPRRGSSPKRRHRLFHPGRGDPGHQARLLPAQSREAVGGLADGELQHLAPPRACSWFRIARENPARALFAIPHSGRVVFQRHHCGHRRSPEMFVAGRVGESPRSRSASAGSTGGRSWPFLILLAL